jgi:hypothetical protein
MEVPDRASGTLSIKPEYCHAILAAKDRMIRHERWKLVYQPLESGCLLRLFDLDTDAECQNDLSGSHPEIKSKLFKRLKVFLHDEAPE